MKNNNTVSVSFMLLGILFCVCLVAANLLETKVVRIWKITATAGLVVFPISYIINDCIAEVWGFRKARLIIWMGFAMNFMVVALGQLAIMMPAAPFWEGEEGFNFVFGMAPRIAVASLTAFLVGSFLNAYVMSKMKLASGGKNFSLRAITSTLVGESADSLIFFPIAFGGLMPVSAQVSLFSLAPSGTISTTGLRWPIRNRRLTAWWQGTLNEATGNNFTVTLSADARIIVYRTLQIM